jgi:16S rRNA (cytidine1402-2'-O)-methyltransferase
MSGILYVVATPIGNPADMSQRAVEILSLVSLIAAEDTRETRALLGRYGIKTPLASCHKFNERERQEFFLAHLREGKDLALVSDAGTPCVSDPGHRLIAAAAGEGITVTSVSGPCAVTTAVSVSGFDAKSFTFVGFLPRAKKDIIETIRTWADMLPKKGAKPPLIFYESPKRITHTLYILLELYPNIQVCLCNDLTKTYERIYRGRPAQVLDELTANPHAEKGEYTCVLVMEPADAVEKQLDELSLEARLTDIIVKMNITLKEAVDNLASAGEQNVTKKEIYAAGLRLKTLFVP